MERPVSRRASSSMLWCPTRLEPCRHSGPPAHSERPLAREVQDHVECFAVGARQENPYRQCRLGETETFDASSFARRARFNAGS